MTSAPEALAGPEKPAAGQERVATDVPGDVHKRLRTWAALRGQHVSRVVRQLITEAVPSADELAEQMRQIGAPDDNQR